MKRTPLVLVALTLAACNANAPPPVAADPGGDVASAQAAELPPPGGCQEHIARYIRVQEQDKSMGHVAGKVYMEIHTEIAAAQKECAAGHEAKAEAMIRASEIRHGYPTGI